MPSQLNAETDADSSSQQQQDPNIIFLLADDLGYGDLHYAGGKAVTPNLDLMAGGEHSVRFDRFYSSSPVCSPTRGSLLTGRNHNRFCVWMANTAGRSCKGGGDFSCHTKNPLPHSERTVAEILKERGYRTAAFGKWHLGDLKSSPGHEHLVSHPGQNGFDMWKVTERAVPTSTSNCGCFNTSLCNLGHYWRRGPPPCTNYHEPVDTSFSSTEDSGPPLKAHPDIILGDDSDFIVDEFTKFLDKTLSENKPFFAYIPFHSVHQNFVATPPYDAPYKKMGLDQEELDYLASISAMDNAVGRIRSLLRNHGISNNTMLWFASDNGPAKSAPGSTGGLRGSKGTLYEGGIRVPGIVEWPRGVRENRVSSHPVTTSDFLPTVLDLLKMNANSPDQSSRTLDGISILALLQNSTNIPSRRSETIKWAFRIAADFSGSYSAVIMDNQYKLIASYKHGEIRQYSLYDLNLDPTESHDIAGQHIALSTSLLMLLEEWLVSVRTSATEEVACL